MIFNVQFEIKGVDPTGEIVGRELEQYSIDNFNSVHNAGHKLLKAYVTGDDSEASNYGQTVFVCAQFAKNYNDIDEAENSAPPINLLKALTSMLEGDDMLSLEDEWYVSGVEEDEQMTPIDQPTNPRRIRP